MQNPQCLLCLVPHFLSILLFQQDMFHLCQCHLQIGKQLGIKIMDIEFNCHFRNRGCLTCGLFIQVDNEVSRETGDSCLPHIRSVFLAVQDSSIGDIVIALRELHSYTL